MSPLEQLRAARALITPVEQWTSGAFARGRSGRSVSPTSPRACRWCAWGALERVGYYVDILPAQRALAAAVPDGTLASVNDTVGHAAVLGIYDAAIAALEATAGAPKGADRG